MEKLSKNNIIGLFNDSYPPIMDGVALTVQNSAYALYQKNQPVCVITPKAPDYIIDEPYPVYRYSSIPLISHQPYRVGVKDVDISFQKTIEKIPLSLVHAHCPFTSGHLALKIAKKRNIPFVATFHSKYRDDFERSFHNKNIVKLLTDKIIEFYEMADEVWIPQAKVEETIREYGYKGKLYVVENINDFSAVTDIEKHRIDARISLNIAIDENVFLFVGQHIWEKNTKMIIEALALLRDLPFKMIFVGTGYAADDMKNLVTELGIDNKVEFIGMITDREILKKYYSTADLFLFPSLYDNAPLVIREASAFCTPSILIKNSTASEVIKDNFNGFLVENTPESLAKKIRTLINSPEIIRKVGVNASKTISKSWDSIADLMLERYNNLMR